jgi:Raf kinase inhibitor-like YbhB/YbcL family protein
VRILKHLLWVIPLIVAVTLISLVAYSATARSADTRYHSKLPKTIQLFSDNFQHEQEIPADFSCKGRAIAPDIRWTNSPDRTRSYVLIAMDWDAPSPHLRLFPVVHWVLYNIPAERNNIPQDSTNASLTRMKIVPGLNVAGQPGYMAPCPPLGTHRYEFRLYALDVDQIQPSSNSKAAVMKAMEEHIVAYGELVGLKRP